MGRTIKKLTALEVAKIKNPGRYCVNDGLYLQVVSQTRRSWLHRFTFNGKARESGLGSYPEVLLGEARKKRDEERAQIRKGIDPVAARKAVRTQALIEQVKNITFKECAETHIKANQAAWRHAGTLQNWKGRFSKYVYPVIGNLPVRDIDTPAVMRVLEQEVDGKRLWEARAKSASVIRSMIESVLDSAKVRGYRGEKENPARWRGHLKEALPKTSKISRSKPRPGLPHAEIPEFIKVLRARKQKEGRWAGGSVSVRALEFIILTGGRATEACGARWPEINFAEKLWVIPAERMKGDREHRVPLSPDLLALLHEMQDAREQRNKGSADVRWLRQEGIGESEFIFQSNFRRGYLSIGAPLRLLGRMGYGHVTVHGFRSSFKTWAAKRYPWEVTETAIAHKFTTKTEDPYWRDDFLDIRRRMMNEWADYCAGKWVAVTAEVIPMRPAAGSSIGLPTP
jgi:integrase